MAMEVKRVRVRREASAEEVRSIDDIGSRNPSAGRAALRDASPGFGDGVEGGVDMWDQLVIDGVAIWSHVGCVDCVRIIVERRLVAESDQNHLRCCAIGLTVCTWNDATVPECREGRSRSGVREGAIPSRPVSLLVNHRVALGAVACDVAVRKENVGADIHVAVPEFAQLLAANLDIFQVRSILVVALLTAPDFVPGEVLGGLYGIELQSNRLRATRYFDIYGRSQETAKPVNIQRTVSTWEANADCRTIASGDFLIKIEESLDSVIAG